MIDKYEHTRNSTILENIVLFWTGIIFWKFQFLLSFTKGKLVWLLTQDGESNIKRAYWFALQLDIMSIDNLDTSTLFTSVANFWKIIWNPQILPRLSLWTWQTFYNRLPIRFELKKRHTTQDDTCTYCNDKVESLYHIFYECDFAYSNSKFVR